MQPLPTVSRGELQEKELRLKAGAWELEVRNCLPAKPPQCQ